MRTATTPITWGGRQADIEVEVLDIGLSLAGREPIAERHASARQPGEQLRQLAAFVRDQGVPVVVKGIVRIERGVDATGHVGEAPFWSSSLVQLLA